jgi:hypothetical protein
MVGRGTRHVVGSLIFYQKILIAIREARAFAWQNFNILLVARWLQARRDIYS